MAELWFGISEKAQKEPYDPSVKDTKTTNKSNKQLDMAREPSKEKFNDTGDKSKSDYFAPIKNLNVERNKSVIPVNHPNSFLYPDELKNVNRQRRNHRIRRSRSRSGVRNSERKADTAYISEQPSGSKVKPTSLEKRKSMKRRAIIKGNSAAEFLSNEPKDESFLGVRLLSTKKQRALSPKSSPNSSPKRRRGEFKKDSLAKYKSSDAFTKHRECKRYTSVVDGVNAHEDSLSSSSITDIDLDMASTKDVAQQIGVSVVSFKRMKSVTELSNSQLVSNHKQFHETFPNGVATKKEFAALAKEIGVNKWEAPNFTNNVFQMFDLNHDQALTFEEFIFATSAKDFDNIQEKLGWLFDHVYDKDRDGRINRMEIKDILKNLLVMEGFDIDTAYWMVEDVFHKLHQEQIKSYKEKPNSSSFEAIEIDGKMDKKQFLAYVEGSNLISGLLSIKCDTTRKEKIEKHIQKVDVNELDVRPSTHSAENSKRSVLSARRSIKKDRKSFNQSTSIHKMLTRSRSISMMEIEDESFCSRRRSLM